jgi:hypothetical protein
VLEQRGGDRREHCDAAQDDHQSQVGFVVPKPQLGKGVMR